MRRFLLVNLSLNRRVKSLFTELILLYLLLFQDLSFAQIL